MIRSVKLFVVAVFLVASAASSGLQAQIPVTWDGGNGRWEATNWTKEGVSGLSALDAMGDNSGGRGGLAISIGGGAVVEFDPNPGSVGGLGDFRPRKDLNGPGSLTIKEGAVLTMDSHSDVDGRWLRGGLDMTLDNGTLRRTYSSPSLAGGKIILGYHGELLPNQKIEINVINGGRLENDGKIVFGELDYFASQGGSNNGHSDGIEIAMTINNGTLDLTGGGYPDYPFGLISGELVFGYEYHENVGPRNEKYSINFTGPGSITVDPHFDTNAGQYLGGIYVAKQASDGSYSPQGGGPDFFTPIGYEDLWNLGILQANGQSGMTGATFSNFFTTTGTKFTENYTLTSKLAAAGVQGDYNNNGTVDAADYVLWRNGGPLQNEVNDPGTISPADYTAWRARFGNPSGSGSALAGVDGAIPEPASLILTLMSGLIGSGLIGSGPRRRR